MYLDKKNSIKVPFDKMDSIKVPTTVCSQGKFSIDAESGEIRVSGPLDREQLASYTLVVQAWDNWYGYPTPESRNAFKQVTVRLEDVSQNIYIP